MTRSGRALRAVVAAACGGPVLGVEREYEVRDQATDRPVDARRIWPALPDPGWWLDPGDRLARRGPWGGVITADGRHAELATPPVALRPGSTEPALALAAAGQRHLADQVPARRLVGFSTHISIEVPDRRVVRVARVVAGRLAIPIMLMLDRVDSPGLLVRPRPGRLEVGGEYAAGDQLRAAVAMTVAMVALAEGAVRRRLRIPPGPTVEPARAVERYGWYVDRHAFGPDLYRHGRATPLGTDTAEGVLARLWSLGRERAESLLSASEVALVDGLVAGERPLPLELPDDTDGPVAEVRTDRDYGVRTRGQLTVAVHRATWWKAVLTVRRGEVQRWITVPGRALDAVLDAVDTGLLDDDLARCAR